MLKPWAIGLTAWLCALAVPAHADAPTASTAWGSVSVGKDVDGRPTATLENSRLRVRFGSVIDGGQPTSDAVEFFLKDPKENENGRFLDASASRSAMTASSVIEDGPSRKTVRLVFGGPDIPHGQATEDVTIYPDSSALRLDYVDWFVNIFDIAGAGGSGAFAAPELTRYTTYGGDHWKRPYVPYPEIYFMRCPYEMGAENITEPDPDGSLNYHGWFIMGITNRVNGRGWGRVVPAHGTDIFKLLFNSGFEIFPYYSREHHRYTTYLYGVTGGPTELLKIGKKLADGAVDGIDPVASTPEIMTSGAKQGVFIKQARCSIACGTPGATIRYTTDGTEPGPTSPIYRTSLQFNATTRVEAAVFKDGWQTSNVADRWIAVTGGPHGDWWDTGFHARVSVDIDAGDVDRHDKVADVPIDFGKLEEAAHLTGKFDHQSLRVVEVDAGRKVIDDAVPFQLDTTTDWFGSPDGTLTILLKGRTRAHVSRRFDVYFDTTDTHLASTWSRSLVSGYERDDWENWQSTRIVTPIATYYTQQYEPGLARLIDRDGVDWIGFGDARKTAALGPTVVSDPLVPDSGKFMGSRKRYGSLRTEVNSESTDHKWLFVWDFYPDCVRVTVQRAPDNIGTDTISFRYRGTLDSSGTFAAGLDAVDHPISQAGSVPGWPSNWVRFGRSDSRRSLFIAPLNAKSESDPAAVRALGGLVDFTATWPQSPTPGQVIIGLVDAKDSKQAARAIASICDPLPVTVGEAEGVPTPKSPP